MKEWDPTGKVGPRVPLPDVVTVLAPKVRLVVGLWAGGRPPPGEWVGGTSLSVQSQRVDMSAGICAQFCMCAATLPAVVQWLCTLLRHRRGTHRAGHRLTRPRQGGGGQRGSNAPPQAAGVGVQVCALCVHKPCVTLCV